MNVDLLDPVILDALEADDLEFQTPALPLQAPARPMAVPLGEVLDLIRRDSRREPQQYLDETVVPHGGE